MEEISDKNVIYVGSNYPQLGISKGQKYDQVIKIILDYITKVQPTTEQPTTNLLYEGDTYCVGKMTLNSNIVRASNRNFNYSVTPTVNGTSISYDLNPLIKDLPSDYIVTRISSTISGKPLRGKTIINEGNKAYTGVTVSNDRFPINIDIDIRVNTPTGDIKLLKSVNIPTPLAGSYTAQLEVQDFGISQEVNKDLDTFIGELAAQVCGNTQDIESYKNVDLVGGEITYPSTDIRDIISTQNTIINELIQKIQKLEVEAGICEGCGSKE